MTRLEELGLERGYSFVFDFGCYHGLNPRQRLAYGRGVNTVAAPGGVLLLMGFTRPVPPVTRGVSAEDLLVHLGSGWAVEWTRGTSSGASAMNRAAAAWFCLRLRVEISH